MKKVELKVAKASGILAMLSGATFHPFKGC
jgi:hypothetical protein